MEIRQPVSVSRDYTYLFVVSQMLVFNTRPVANGSGGFGKYILESIIPYFVVYFFISGGLVCSKYVLMCVLHLRTTIYLSLGARSASFILDIWSLIQKRSLFWQVPSYSGQVFFIFKWYAHESFNATFSWIVHEISMHIWKHLHEYIMNSSQKSSRTVQEISVNIKWSRTVHD